MPTLYDVSTEFARIELLLSERGGEWTEDVEVAFLALGEMERSKVDAYRAVITNLTAHAEACENEAKRFQEKAGAAMNAARRLKDRLHEYMTQRDVTELSAYVEAGMALLEIREARLYLGAYDTFDDYRRDEWNMGRIYAHRLIRAATAVSVLPIGNRPKSESIARELVPLRLEPAKINET